MHYHNLLWSLYSLLCISIFIFFGSLPISINLLEKKLNRKFSGIELIVYSLIVGILYLGILGIILSLIPANYRHVLAIALLALPVLYGTWLCMLNSRNYFKIIGRNSINYAFLLIIFCAILLMVSNLIYKLPDILIDGPYVNKDKTTAVAIQYITGGLPADNQVPFVVEEYLAGDIDFKINSPILPGQQVTNRPILMALCILPIRLALGGVAQIKELPKFTYLNIEWPNFTILVQNEKIFAIFLGSAIFLNSCFALSLCLISSYVFQGKSKYTLAVLLICFSSSYFIFETIFTWPKLFAGFFLISGFYIYYKNKNILFSSVCVGLAYLAHPYSIAFFIVSCPLVLYYSKIKNLGIFITGFIFTISPWLIWSKFILRINSDLIDQNFKFLSLYNFLFIRISNILTNILPIHLLNSDSSFNIIYWTGSRNFIGSIGSFLFLFFTVKYLISNIKIFDDTEEGIFLKKIISYFFLCSLLLAMVFSIPAVPILHGWQALIGLTIVLIVFYFKKIPSIYFNFIWLQIILNLILSTLYFYSLTL